MADHRLRTGAGAPGAGVGAGAAAANSSVAAGLVFGINDPQRIEITNSTEIAVSVMPDGSIDLDAEFLYTQKDLMSKVFPESEVLGWYIVSGSDAIGAVEQSLHRQISELRAAIPLRPGSHEPAPAPELLTRALCDVPILLHLNDANVAAQRRVPLQILVKEDTGEFSQVPYKIEASDVERITVDHVTTSSALAAAASSAAATIAAGARAAVPTASVATITPTPEAVQLASSAAALSVLSERLDVLEAYLTAARSGTVRADRAVLRHIAGVLNAVPIADASGSGGTSQVHADIAKDTADGLAVSLLANVVKGADAAAALADRLHTADLMAPLDGQGQGQGHHAAGGAPRRAGRAAGGGDHDGWDRAASGGGGGSSSGAAGAPSSSSSSSVAGSFAGLAGALRGAFGGAPQTRRAGSGGSGGGAADSDEAMARRLQEDEYRGGRGGR